MRAARKRLSDPARNRSTVDLAQSRAVRRLDLGKLDQCKMRKPAVPTRGRIPKFASQATKLSV
jgi:hypothetical protein